MQLDEKKRERSANFSNQESCILINEILKKKEIIENKKTDAVTSKQKEEAWVLITSSFNAQSGINNRTTKALKIRYEVIKRQLKKKWQHNKMQIYKTGGGCKDNVPLLDYEEKLLPIISLSVEGLPSISCSDALTDVDNEASSIEKPLDDLAGARIITLDMPEDYNVGDTLIVEDNSNTLILENNIQRETNNNCIGLANEAEKCENWVTWTPKQLKSTKNKKLTQTIYSKNTVNEINDKFCSLTESRQQLVELQLEAARKEVEVKNLEIELKQKELMIKEKELLLLDLKIKKYD